ncbi:glycosyltransferase family 61 protein [Halorubrum lipolyticum]|uniref:glycosyltransferase family 61 protein n=1 Tax=Halorubrum lipolyticum TaxID=368624 RepID=UPI0009E581F8|nr:glycosyltransferase family 61 protein [Halorubrum lipolyticum]
MYDIIKRILKEYQLNGLRSLVDSGVSEVSIFFKNKKHEIFSRFLVFILKASGKTTTADEKCENKYLYATSEKINVTTNGQSSHPDIQSAIGDWRSDPRHLYFLNQVRLVGRYGLGFSSEGELIWDTVANSQYMLNSILQRMISDMGVIRTYNIIYNAIVSKHIDIRNSEYDYSLSMMNTNSNNYYHWTVEYLARLRGVDSCPEVSNDEVELLLLSSAPQYVKESLSILGFKSYQTWNEDIEQIDRLIVPDHTFRSRHHEFGIAPSDLEWVRKKMLNNLSTKSNIKNKRIYISREDSKNGREVINDQELNAILNNFGFQKYRLSELSVRDQIELFSNAEIVIGPHGAGFGNLIYSTSSTTVVELYGEELPQGKFFVMLANEIGSDYYNIRCQVDDNNIYVPTNRVEKLLDNILTKQIR